MIDIENFVFDTFYNYLISLYPNANITNGYDEENASSLTIIIREINNLPVKRTATDACAENHAKLTYEIEVICDEESTGRIKCKAVLADVDTAAQSMKMTRIHKNRPINIDRTRWRQYARYEVIVGKPVTYDAGTQNERTVYQMYRRVR